MIFLCTGAFGLEVRENELGGEGGVVFAGDDEIGVFACGFNVGVVHGAHGGGVLMEDGCGCAASFLCVAFKTTRQADVCVGVDVNFEIEEAAQIGIFKEENAFYNDDGCGWEGRGFGFARMGGEVVDGDFYGMALNQVLQMGDEQVGFEGVGMVKVGLGALLNGQVRLVAIISIVCYDMGISAQFVAEILGQGGFA